MISKEKVKHIAKLSRLELTEKEIEKMQKDLSSILDYFNVLKKAPKLKLKEKPYSESSIQSGRHDEIASRPASLANNLIQAAPDKKDNYIKVKAIL